MSPQTAAVLLDTCAVIWMSENNPIADDAREAINAAPAGSVRVSPISAWEVGMLAAKGRLPLTVPPANWFAGFRQASQTQLQDLSPDVLIAASFLPGDIHKDPVDRILIATAREHDLRIVTRDRAILAYGAAGHVKTLAC